MAARFSSLDSYLENAKKTIRTHAPKSEVQALLKSEDAISEVARHMMMADWDYDASRKKKPENHRIQYGIWAIRDFLGLSKTKANKQLASLDKQTSINGDGDGVTLGNLTKDVCAKDPCDIAKDSERRAKVKAYVEFLLKNTILSEAESKCLKLKFLEEVESDEEVGKLCDPPITRQAVGENIDRALRKLRLNAVGKD